MTMGVFFGRRPYGRSFCQICHLWGIFCHFRVLRGVPHKALCLKNRWTKNSRITLNADSNGIFVKNRYILKRTSEPNSFLNTYIEPQLPLGKNQRDGNFFYYDPGQMHAMGPLGSTRWPLLPHAGRVEINTMGKKSTWWAELNSGQNEWVRRVHVRVGSGRMSMTSRFF